MGWYKNLANEHSDLVKYKTIGQTAGGRDMIAVQITASTSQRNKVYMQCLIHASKPWHLYFHDKDINFTNKGSGYLVQCVCIKLTC